MGSLPVPGFRTLGAIRARPGGVPGPRSSAADAGFGVGVHRFAGRPQPLRRGDRLFGFVGYDVLREAATIESTAANNPRPHGQRQV